jgi:predicted nucleotidyltransferase
MYLLQQDEKLKTAVQALKSEFSPSRLILFGSRANGTATKESDYDFVMVVKGANDNQWDEISRARNLLVKVGVDADVFIYSESEFDEWKGEFSSIPEVASTTGHEINLNE